MIKKSILCVLFLFVALSLFGEVFYVETIEVNVEGITSRAALLRELDLKEGKEFSSEESIINFINLSKDTLDDMRLFRSVTIFYDLGTPQGERIPVTLTVDVIDSWNLAILPIPSYDSNDGFEMSLKVRDYNFLGQMEPLRISFDYVYDDYEKQNEFEISASYTFNFPIREHNFYLKVGQEFNYLPDDDYGDTFYMGSSLKFGTSYVLPWDIYEGNYLNYNLYTTLDKDYSLEEISDERDEVELGFTHGLNLGQTSWDGNNYRDGFSSSLVNDWEYNWDSNPDNDSDSDDDDDEIWSVTLTGLFQYHKDFYPMGYSGRVGVVQNVLNDTTSNIDDYFRGILEREDREAGGYIFMNNALYLTIWNNESFWEIMGGPCLDVGYLWQRLDGVDALAWSVGLEGLCYPAFAKSFQARLTIGMSGNGFTESSGSTASKIKENLEIDFQLGKFF
ncbi:MAG: hypothetical protein PQJ60_06055 [Spirochaetales bacterium]|nr:hypothetical protein [Spirochaetales bacterium]